MRLFLFGIAAAAVLSPAAAQGTFVVPSKANISQPGAVYPDGSAQQAPFWGTSSTRTTSRVQYLYDVADIPITSATLTAMSFRNYAHFAPAASTYQTTLVLSVGPRAPTNAASVFADNHGASTTVFSGAVNLPAAIGGTWPRPWQTPIVFSTPFAFDAANGASLVVDFTTTSSSSGQAWTLEGYDRETGQSFSEHSQPQCFHSGGTYNNTATVPAQNLIPGGMFVEALTGYPNGTPSLATNALMFAVEGTGAAFGPYTTPVLLSTLGLPAPPNCQLSVVPLASMPMAYVEGSTTASLQLSFALNNDPAIGGATFFTQNIALDTSPQGQALWYPSWAFRWLIGTGNPVPVTRVWTTYDPQQPRTSGAAAFSDGATLQFHY